MSPSVMPNAFFRLFLQPRAQKILDNAPSADDIQRKVLRQLISRAADTVWGFEHQYRTIRSYDDFARLVPVTDYEGLKLYIDRMRHGERDVLWPGLVRWYAKSSGTTADKSKFIPVSDEGLRDIHYRGGADTVALYLHNRPDAAPFSGKGLILGGSHAPNCNLPGTLVGDLSAILIENINPAVNLFRVPPKEVALLADFEEKMERIVQCTRTANVTNLSGVPSWMMAVLEHMLQVTGAPDITAVWPNLEVFFHGGVAFTPYREQYRRLIPSDRMQYMETYNASEGFFGLQSDPTDAAMLLMTDYGVFYEFIPMDRFGAPDAPVLPLWEVQTGVNYAMVITTSCGLWRYIIGDTIRFTSTRPYKFVITGRTRHFINAFGEELIVDNAEQGLREACRQTGAQVREYTAAPVFMDADARCRHQWLIDFAVPPQDLSEFARILDTTLQQVNSDYEAKRYKNLTLQPLEIIVAHPGLFDRWLKSKGKLGGQHKVPRLSNSRQHIDELLALNTSENP